MKFVNVHVDKHEMFMNFTKSSWFQMFITNCILPPPKKNIVFVARPLNKSGQIRHYTKILWLFCKQQILKICKSEKTEDSAIWTLVTSHLIYRKIIDKRKFGNLFYNICL